MKKKLKYLFVLKNLLHRLKKQKKKQKIFRMVADDDPPPENGVNVINRVNSINNMSTRISWVLQSINIIGNQSHCLQMIKKMTVKYPIKEFEILQVIAIIPQNNLHSMITGLANHNLLIDLVFLMLRKIR